MSQRARMRGRRWAGEWSIVALLMLTSICWASHVQAADDPQSAIASERAAHSLLIDAAQAGKRLVVVGDRGHILYSDDQGETWTQAQVPSRQLLTAVYFVDAQHGWAVGHDAQVLASDDGGVTWRKQFEDLEREAPLLDVLFVDTRHGFAVGAYGALLETRDGGQQWQDISERLDNPDQLHLNAIARVTDRGLFIVGEQGSMFRSSDDGQSWTSVHGPYEGSLFGVLGTARPATLLAYGLRGNLLRSSDFGDTWQRITLSTERGPFAAGLSGAALLADGRVVLVGNAGSVLLSEDGGERFTVYSRRDRIALAGVAGLAEQRLLLVGQGGIHLADGQGRDLEVQP